MKIKDIKSMKGAEMAKALKELQAKLAAVRFGAAGSKSKNVKEIHNLKKDVARILTILNLKK